MKAIDVFRMAYATSRHNEPGRIADENGELVTLLNELLASYHAEASRINRRFFGERFDVEYDGEVGGWPRPERAEMVVQLKAGTGMKTSEGSPIDVGKDIVDLPYDQLHIEPGRPAVYSWGQVWYPAGRESDPVEGMLTVLASAAPEPLSDRDSNLPAKWPKTSVALLKWDIAIYLAVKDGDREAEVAAFREQRDREHARFLALVEHESITETRSYGHGGRFTPPGVRPR